MGLEAVVSEYDIKVVIDTSGSMGEPNKYTDKHGRTRWDAMQETMFTFVRDVEKIDTDGIDVVRLGGSCEAWQNVGSDKIRDIFMNLSPRGGTPLAEALTKALSIKGTPGKKQFIAVFTDGVPDDQNAVAQVIKKQANSQETDDACTILFVQVGDDRQATAYLKMLDDDLKGAKFDIVDAKTIEEADKFASTAELIVAAIAD